MVGGGIDESNVYISGSVCVNGSPVPFTDLKLLAFKDQAGALVAVQWYPVHLTGFTLSGGQTAFDPGMLYMAEISSTTANSYSIKNADTMMVAGDVDNLARLVRMA